MTDDAEIVREFAESVRADCSRLPGVVAELSLKLTAAGGGAFELEGVFGGHEFRREGAELADVLAQAADAVVDDVIDELGRGWPELTDDSGGYAGILIPGSTAAGVGWFNNGALYARFGELAGALGDRVRWHR